MNHDLKDLLESKNYTRVKLKETITNHLEFKATINGVVGSFILDTGASSSCVGFNNIEYFKLLAEDSQIKAAGAGASDMLTQSANKNVLKIGKWQYNNLSLVLFDLSHVNNALINHDSQPVDGIIGADVLKKSKAIIDYSQKYLYLKLKTKKA